MLWNLTLVQFRHLSHLPHLFGWIAQEFVVPLGAIHLGRCECGNRARMHTKNGPNKRTKTSSVSRSFQGNSGVVRLRWEHDPNLIRPNCWKNGTFLDWTSYKSGVLPVHFSSCLFSSRSWDFGPTEEQLRKLFPDTINDVNVHSDRPDRALWYENELKWLKNENCLYNFLPSVCTKQSEQQMWKQRYWVHLSLQAVSCQYGCLELVLLDSMIRWNNHIGIFWGVNL